jgi:hypothetical protein
MKCACVFVKGSFLKPLCFLKNCFQMSLHVPCGFNQLELLKNFCDFLSNHFVWASSVLFYTDKEILEENNDSYHVSYKKEKGLERADVIFDRMHHSTI